MPLTVLNSNLALLPNFAADIVLGVAVVSVALFVVLSFIWLFSTGGSSTICGLTAEFRGKALEDWYLKEDLTVNGKVNAVNIARLKFPWPFICKTEEKGGFTADKESIASVLATTSAGVWQTLQAGKYDLFVGDEDEDHLNAKRMAVFQTKIEENFYPSDFFDFMENNEFVKGKKIADVLPPQNIHFIYEGKVIDGLSDMPIVGDVWFTIYYVDRVVGGQFNYFGRAVIGAPECGIYGGFPSNSEIEDYTTVNDCESFADIFKDKEKEYCECKKEVDDFPACSYQLPSDQIWICISRISNLPNTPSYRDVYPPILVGFDYCVTEDSCTQLKNNYLETTNEKPLIRGRIKDADAVAVSNTNPQIQYGCGIDDCFYFIPENALTINEETIFTAELSDNSGNTASGSFTLKRLPAVSATIDATDYVNSKVDISLDMNGKANNVKVSVTNGAVTFGPNAIGSVNAGVYTTSFSGFTIEHEGAWNIVVSGTDTSGMDINVIGEKTFVVDLTPPTASVDAVFTQTSGYTRGGSPQISVDNSGKHYVVYSDISNGEKEVFVIESN